MLFLDDVDPMPMPKELEVIPPAPAEEEKARADVANRMTARDLLEMPLALWVDVAVLVEKEDHQ